MAYFARLDDNNIVTQVISVNNAEIVDADGNESEQIGIEWCRKWSGGWQNWKQTSFNRSIRKHFAGIGSIYDVQRDAFIPVKPFNSWVLDEETCDWKAPIPTPEVIPGHLWVWDELSVNWRSVKFAEVE